MNNLSLIIEVQKNYHIFVVLYSIDVFAPQMYNFCASLKMRSGVFLSLKKLLYFKIYEYHYHLSLDYGFGRFDLSKEKEVGFLNVP